MHACHGKSVVQVLLGPPWGKECVAGPTGEVSLSCVMHSSCRMTTRWSKFSSVICPRHMHGLLVVGSHTRQHACHVLVISIALCNVGSIVATGAIVGRQGGGGWSSGGGEFESNIS